MKSDLPKCLFPVCGVPMAELIGRELLKSGVQRPCIVIGHKGQLLIDALGGDFDYAWQHEQLGTGHAVRMALDAYPSLQGTVIIAPGDVPLLSATVFKSLAERHKALGAACSVATITLENPTGYGRVVRDGSGNVCEIVEEKDASESIKTLHEVNSGVYCFEVEALRSVIEKLRSDNAQAEYYLTDCIRLLSQEGKDVAGIEFEDAALLQGVNDRWQLAQCQDALRLRILRQHCLNGVSIADPGTTFVDLGVEIGADTLVHPMTTITRGTRIGERCQVGPQTIIDKSVIGNDTSINMSRVNEATVGDRCKIGPFTHLRPLTVVGNDCKIGNFVEIKKSDLKEGVAASHLAYIGDATIGPATNVGAGVITCNYDGFSKHRTEIGARVFVGSNSTLVAPLTIEDDAFVAAGSTITKPVPSEALAVARVRQETREGWVIEWRKRKSTQSAETGS